MQVWDIGGQSIAGEMLDKYIYGAAVSTFVHRNSSTYSRRFCWQFYILTEYHMAFQTFSIPLRFCTLYSSEMIAVFLLL